MIRFVGGPKDKLHGVESKTPKGLFCARAFVAKKEGIFIPGAISAMTDVADPTNTTVRVITLTPPYLHEAKGSRATVDDVASAAEYIAGVLKLADVTYGIDMQL